MKVATVLLLVGSAAAFAPSSKGQTSTALSDVLDGLPGNTAPLKSFDPLGLATVGSEDTLKWLQAAELKHGRTSMVAFVGWMVGVYGIHFPGMLSPSAGISFEDLSAKTPLEAWDAVPAGGRAQILLSCFIAEFVSETKKPHYMNGGDFPKIVFPPVDLSNTSDGRMAHYRSAEINNGRLAMIGILGFFSEAGIPGSVPGLTPLGIF